MPVPKKDNPFLKAREHAKAKQAIENKYEQEQQKQRIKQEAYRRDLHELIEQPSKQRDLYQQKILDIQHQQEQLEQLRLESLSKYEMYRDAAQAGKAVFRERWADDDVYGLSRPVEQPPQIPDFENLPTVHILRSGEDDDGVNS